jgi:hypothetical protein
MEPIMVEDLMSRDGLLHNWSKYGEKHEMSSFVDSDRVQTKHIHDNYYLIRVRQISLSIPAGAIAIASKHFHQRLDS